MYFKFIFTARTNFYLLFLIIAYIRAMGQHFQVINFRLSRLHRITAKRNLKHRFSIRISHLILHHISGCRKIQSLNQELVSKALFVVCMHLWPSNVWLMVGVVGGRVHGIERYFSLVLWSMQMVTLPVILLPPAILHATVHKARRHLLSIQLATRKSLLLKVKIEAHYDRLVRNNRYGFTVGPLGISTYRYIFEVCSKEKN